MGKKPEEEERERETIVSKEVCAVALALARTTGWIGREEKKKRTTDKV